MNSVVSWVAGKFQKNIKNNIVVSIYITLYNNCIPYLCHVYDCGNAWCPGCAQLFVTDYAWTLYRGLGINGYFGTFCTGSVQKVVFQPEKKYCTRKYPTKSTQKYPIFAPKYPGFPRSDHYGLVIGWQHRRRRQASVCTRFFTWRACEETTSPGGERRRWHSPARVRQGPDSLAITCGEAHSLALCWRGCALWALPRGAVLPSLRVRVRVRGRGRVWEVAVAVAAAAAAVLVCVLTSCKGVRLLLVLVFSVCGSLFIIRPVFKLTGSAHFVDTPRVVWRISRWILSKLCWNADVWE